MPKATKQMPTRKKAAKKRVVRKSTGSILDRAQTSIEYDSEEPFSMGIFGAPGSGKTTTWCTWPKPILAVMCSGGLKKPGEFKSIPKKDREGISPLYLNNCEEMNEVTDALKDSEYKTVVLDHLTSFSDLCIQQILGLEDVPPQLSWGFASQQQWGQVAALVKGFLKNLIELPMHSVIVAQQRWFEPPEGSEIAHATAGPAVTPSIAGWLVPALDYNIQTFVRDEVEEKIVKIAGSDKVTQKKTGSIEHCAYLPFCTDRMTKFRVPKGFEFEEVMVDPSFEKLNGLILRTLE